MRVLLCGFWGYCGFKIVLCFCNRVLMVCNFLSYFRGGGISGLRFGFGIGVRSE